MSIEYRWLETDEFVPIYRKHRAELFSGNVGVDVSRLLSDAEREKADRLSGCFGKDLVRLNLVAVDGPDLCGWSWGCQDSGEKFYMVNSAVFPKWRRQGLYTAMVNKMLERTTDLGFQIVWSRHHATNNAIIIAKLKAGFVIGGMEIYDRGGTMVHLFYHANPERHAVMDFRCGYRSLSPDLCQLLCSDSPSNSAVRDNSREQ